METLLGLGFSVRDTNFWTRLLAQGLYDLGDRAAAEQIMRASKKR